MAVTYEKIASTTLTGTATTVTFSSIPATYTDIVMVCNPLSTSGDTYFQLNGDTGTNYSLTYLTANGSAVYSGRTTSANYIYLDWLATSTTTGATNYIVNFMNYANTTTYKTTIGRENNATAGVGTLVGLWRSTAAINQIKVTAVGTLQIGSTYTLYGIKAA